MVEMSYRNMSQRIVISKHSHPPEQLRGIDHCTSYCMYVCMYCTVHITVPFTVACPTYATTCAARMELQGKRSLQLSTNHHHLKTVNAARVYQQLV
jgi:hypothetical protein